MHDWFVDGIGKLVTPLWTKFTFKFKVKKLKVNPLIPYSLPKNSQKEDSKFSTNYLKNSAICKVFLTFLKGNLINKNWKFSFFSFFAM